jgi:uncharacterized membrane protein YdjX (TVP38/TMEM64 family)
VSPTRRVLLLALGVAVLAAVAFTLPLTEIPAAVARLGLLAPVAGVAVGAALLIALVPRTPISLACGLLFGAVTGALCALLVALVAAAVTFAAGRWLGREFVARRAGRHWHRLEDWIVREGALAVATVRALPIGPYGLSGYAYGASGIRLRPYAVGTFVAAVPSAISYALLGAAVAGPGRVSPLSLLPLAVSVSLAIALVTRARYLAARSVTGRGRRVEAGSVPAERVRADADYDAGESD